MISSPRFAMLALCSCLVTSAALEYGTPHQRPVIVDTDVDVDDMMAITYLLNHPYVDVRGISVDSNGFSMQWAGVGNVMRLTQKFGQAHIPVAFQDRYMVTQLNGEWGAHPNNLPLESWMLGASEFLESSIPTPWNPLPPSSMSAPELILATLREANGTVDVLALGTWTNLAEALHRDRELFLSKVGTIYVSGGRINPPHSEPELHLKRRRHIKELIANGSISSGFPWKYPPYGGSWNLFLDPISASQVMSSGVDLVFMLDNAQDMLTVNETDDEYIPSTCPPGQRNFLTDLYKLFGEAGGQPMKDVRYWDPSAAVLMTQLMHSRGKGEAPVCTDLASMNVSLSLHNGPHYSWVEEQPFGAQARGCLAGNMSEFKSTYYRHSCRCPRGCS